MQQYFETNKDEWGRHCGTSYRERIAPPNQRPHCAPVTDSLADQPYFQSHPHAFWGQRGLSSLVMTLHKHLPRLQTFCDVGANFGDFTNEFLVRWGGARGRDAGTGLRGLAVEPLPHNAFVLRRRFKMERRDRRITVVQMAVSDTTAASRQLFGTWFGPERGELLGLTDNVSITTLRKRRSRGHWHLVNVTTVQALALAHRLDLIDVLKIDTGNLNPRRLPSVRHCRVRAMSNPHLMSQKASRCPSFEVLVSFSRPQGLCCGNAATSRAGQR